MITGKTKLLGVIGYPIEHSLSPIMHNAAIAHLGLDYAYLPFPIPPAKLEPAIAGFDAIGVQGFSITIPHKQAILPLLASVTEIAQAVGAVNTVWHSQQGWSGTNTDVEGFLAPLKSLARDWSQVVAVILGNGGASRAVVAGCHQLGCAEIHVVGRDSEKLEKFLKSWMHSPLNVNLKVHTWSNLAELLPGADLLVNTTPVGMAPHSARSPLSPAEVDLLPSNLIAYDLIYTPNPTLFLQQAQGKGAIALDGLEMLVQQGAAALRIWLQQEVPIDVMRRSLRQHLGWE
ncbi:shikimate dehydrogenase [Leptothermofonsia sichuanensis E412]|uniref:shikimate dehydrogenase n=1 Tax=Leptothermofonsia sichuanensis TaxID=2917832 RepID=UPI001CA6F2B9|nr:shikimate dehydrogenase [Leptothermofonsia sichuanensis]QZZ19277.1 shikimate dehydrogenase [Leptothermofonsia sichuanensis E412]